MKYQQRNTKEYRKEEQKQSETQIRTPLTMRNHYSKEILAVI